MAEVKVPSETVLNLSTERGIKFLGAVSNNSTIFGYLATRGYSSAVHEKGWELLHAVTGFRRPLGAPVSNEGRKALEEIDAWDEPNFEIARAALEHEFPDQAEYLFEDLRAATGAGAIVSVTTFLDRRDVLKSGKGRKDTKKEDTGAVKKLAERGIDDAECERLRALLAVAQAPAPRTAKALPTDAKRDPIELQNAKLALHGWLSEWRSIAATLIKRRDYLFQLGLAERKVKNKSKREPDVTPALEPIAASPR